MDWQAATRPLRTWEDGSKAAGLLRFVPDPSDWVEGKYHNAVSMKSGENDLRSQHARHTGQS